MKRLNALILAIALCALSGCKPTPPALPASPAPNVEWALLYPEADKQIKALDPEATLLRVGGVVELDPANPAQRLMFTYMRPDFTSLSILVTQENNTISTTEIFSSTINPAAENIQRSDNESPFPNTRQAMDAYARRTGKIQVSPREAVMRALAEEPNHSVQCRPLLLDVSLAFQRSPDAPVWRITRHCQSPADASSTGMIFYDVNAETGQVLFQKEVK